MRDRSRPSIRAYDYLALHTLARDVCALLDEVEPPAAQGRALDLGSATSPYRRWIEARGFAVETLDIDPRSGADHIADAADAGLPARHYDLIVCTQVLEHVPEPVRVLAEVVRMLKPGGTLLASAPHVWFHHPHPGDYWRFTAEGVQQMCAAAGLRVVDLRSQGGSALALFQILNFLMYGAIGAAGTPLYVLSNLLGRLSDAVVKDTRLSHNYAWLARA